MRPLIREPTNMVSEFLVNHRNQLNWHCWWCFFFLCCILVAILQQLYTVEYWFRRCYFLLTQHFWYSTAAFIFHSNYCECECVYRARHSIIIFGNLALFIMYFLFKLQFKLFMYCTYHIFVSFVYWFDERERVVHFCCCSFIQFVLWYSV